MSSEQALSRNSSSESEDAGAVVHDRQPASGRDMTEAFAVDRAVPDLWSGEIGRRLTLPAVTAVEGGSFVALAEPDADLLGQRGTVFGGWLACVTDHVAGVATAAYLDAATAFLTTDLRVRFQRPVGARPVTFTATPRGVGARLVEVTVCVEQSGMVCCRAEVTQVIARRKP